MNMATLPMTNLFGTHLTPFLPFSTPFHGQNAKILILIGVEVTHYNKLDRILQ
jgi:hypothetical protein